MLVLLAPLHGASILQALIASFFSQLSNAHFSECSNMGAQCAVMQNAYSSYNGYSFYPPSFPTSMVFPGIFLLSFKKSDGPASRLAETRWGRTVVTDNFCANSTIYPI